MIYLANIRDWLKTLISADYYYIGKLDGKNDKSIGVYQRKNPAPPIVAVGQPSSYEIKPISILIHWSKNANETEKTAYELYKQLEAVSSLDLNGTHVYFINLLQSEPVDVGTDDNGVYELAIFSGEVYSCRLNKDRIIRKLVAYDRFYWRGQIDCTNWYRSLFDSGESIPTIKLGELRLAILKNFKIIQEQTLNYEELVPLPADNIDVYRISDNVTVGELLRQICEINGCFMYFNGKGNVEYILVNDDKHTHENTENYGHYIDIETEDFEKTAFDGIYITGFENKGKGIFDFDGSEQENLYFMEENRVITAGYKPQEFNMEFFKCRNSIEPNYKISYTPLRLKSEYRCWVELGDRITVEILWYDLDGIKQQIKLKSLVLSRSLSGIQAITDEISAGGEKVRYTEEYFASTKEDGD